MEENTQPEQNCMDLLAAASAYVYRDETLMSSTGGFIADLRHFEDHYLEGTCLGSLFLYACLLLKLWHDYSSIIVNYIKIKT